MPRGGDHITRLPVRLGICRCHDRVPGRLRLPHNGGGLRLCTMYILRHERTGRRRFRRGNGLGRVAGHLARHKCSCAYNADDREKQYDAGGDDERGVQPFSTRRSLCPIDHCWVQDALLPEFFGIIEHS